MAFLDEFKSEFEKNIEKSLSNVVDFTTKQALSGVQLVLTGQKPSGNLSEAELNAGQRPGIPTVNANNNDLNNSIQSQGQGGGVMSQPWVKYAAIGSVVLVVALLLMKKGRRRL